jgi:hypothetical protein
VHLHHPEGRLADVELEGLEHLVSAEPHELAVPAFQRWAEHVRVAGADFGVRTVGREHQVVLGAQRVDVRSHGAEVHKDAQLYAPFLQDLQQLLAPHRREALTARGVSGAPEVDVDVVPLRETLLHARIHDCVGVLDAAEGLVAEHDTEPEGVGRGVALPDGHLVAGVQLLDQRRKIQATRSAAHHRNLHDALRSGPWVIICCGCDARRQIALRTVKR